MHIGTQRAMVFYVVSMVTRKSGNLVNRNSRKLFLKWYNSKVRIEEMPYSLSKSLRILVIPWDFELAISITSWRN